MNFSHAILRKPCKKISEGISSANLGKPNYKRAVSQHENYAEVLRKCGLKLTILPANESYPDSTFVEDTAILTEKCAIITRPGAESRRGEIDSIEKVLPVFFDTIEYITASGTLDGGDVLRVEDHFYIGLSKRTNQDGADQLINILNKFGYSGCKIENIPSLHLKSSIAYLHNNILLLSEDLKNHKEFQDFEQIIVPRDENYAANSIWVNNKIVIPEGYRSTRKQIEARGYETIPVDTSEFKKIDGGLSCLSLRF